MKRWICELGICALVLAAAGCHKQAPPAAFQMPPAAVTVFAASTSDAPMYLDEIGTCTARQYVSIIPQVTGPITQLHFQDGAELHKGELLFTIDPRPYQAALDQAVALMHQSQAAVDFAQTEFKRMADLLPSKAVSQDDYDTKKNALDVAVAQLASAKAAVETARLNVEYTTIFSPIDGRAGERLVDPGNVVTANQTPLLVVQTVDPIYADFTCSEEDLPSVRAHAADRTLRTVVKLPSDVGNGREGDLTFIDTQVVNQGGVVKLRATLSNPDRHFWPGQFVKVRLILSVEKNAVLVPATAIQIGQNGSFLYVVKGDSTAELRPIIAGQRQGDMVVVEKGVSPGEKVIATGQLMVIPGMPVMILPATASAPPGASGGSAEGKS
jgi:multidrug efflux system membrane fusion protein